MQNAERRRKFLPEFRDEAGEDDDQYALRSYDVSYSFRSTPYELANRSWPLNGFDRSWRLGPAEDPP